ncbi:uncharacterized protein [Primulina huaijiensis]|uniref:uncharacterized protein n=1 Tax=Primulina huaijiensis TaxID=1492673 RepID=UPI003CC71417
MRHTGTFCEEERWQQQQFIDYRELNRVAQNRGLILLASGSFGILEDRYLIRIPSAEEVDTSKVEEVRDWPVPKSVTEICSFLGLTGYYMKCIQGFSSISVPMAALTKKNVKFIWGPECQESFDRLKQELTTTPVLAMTSGQVQPTLRDEIRLGQTSDEQLQKWRQRDEDKGQRLYTVLDGIVRYRDRLWDPVSDSLREDILSEAHSTLYSIHPGSKKMYKDLQSLYWWPGMKRDILRFVSECLTCQQVKADHQRPAWKLRSLPIPE